MPSDNSGQPLVNAADSEIPDSNRDLIAEAYLAGHFETTINHAYAQLAQAFGIDPDNELLAADDEAVLAVLNLACAEPVLIECARARLRKLGIGDRD
ncbi:hypothetical protein ACFWWS_36700 [Streptomyces sp. NPDC059083]|uniref:hypothetical protein n=1 Tax=Streptomyces sp. NPDC059083 TaxID=3346721 RepID=UPI0036D176D0